MKVKVSLLFLFFFNILFAQYVRIGFTVSTDLVNQTNVNAIKTLEKSTQDFLNNIQWGTNRGSIHSDIFIEMLLNISAVDNNSYSGNLQIQSGRLIFETNYVSPLINYLDNNFSFSYEQFQPFYYDLNRFNNNFISVLSYYINLSIGMEMDSFNLFGGTLYYENARTIANAAQSNNANGWEANTNQNGRYDLVDQLISPAFEGFRKLIYHYHRNGLDVMTKQNLDAKQSIAKELVNLQNVMRRQPNSYLIQSFFDVKSEEIGLLFSSGPEIEINELLTFLNRYVPTMSNYWNSIPR